MTVVAQPAGAHPADGRPGSTSAALSAFRGQPWSVAVLVAALVVVAGVVFGWNFGYRGYPAFYGDAVRSMSLSWRAFFFGSFDPAATVTLDKLAGFLVPQALSARIFGSTRGRWRCRG